MSLVHWCYSVALGILLIGFSEDQIDLTMSFENNSVFVSLYKFIHRFYFNIFFAHLHLKELSCSIL